MPTVVNLKPRWRRPAAALSTLLCLVAGCSPAAPPATRTPTVTPSAVTPPAAATPGPGHVVVAVFENKASQQLAGNPDAPYFNALIAGSAVFDDAHGVAHPSQPNYLALFSGSTHGVTDDHCPVRAGSAPNLAQQLLTAGYTFTGFSEDLPAPGYRGCSSGRYAAKHNPWADFDNIPAQTNQPYTAWPADFARLPTVAFVIPNLCNDMHDCSIATGDVWAHQHLEPYRQWAQAHDSWLIVTFDEDDGGSANRILTLVSGAGITPGPRTGTVDHYSVLRTIEDRYELEPIGLAAGATPLPGLH
ncbi:acid phosphatase [Dactylosporangium vinaceum]|uniref:Alkaline phosphatase family protein n=1 Tax=Dactylosporangium vinaceum TaxID=53362 RepID=A0ABV5M2B9_9ACTN|nr:alkaline phosphatase family protein [Dactylosporangium vinaceum]UAB96232.1 acid phosphatase [Dactylosporangium vinaceum]